MKVFNEINSQGIFYFNDLELPGVLVTKANSPIEIKVVTNTELSILSEEGNNLFNGKIRKIPLVHGLLKNENKIFTLVDAILYSSFWSSNGLFEYTIKSNLMIFDIFIENIDTFEVSNVSIISSILNQLIGNSQLAASFKISEGIWNINIEKEKHTNLGKSSGTSLTLNSFYNFDKYSMKSKMVVEQINLLKFVFDKGKKIYELITFIRTIENYLSFVFQGDLGIDEAVFFIDESVNGKTLTTFKHLYYNDEDRVNADIDITKYLIKDDQVEKNIGRYIFKWIALTKKIPYLNCFIRFYYSNRFLDQKIIGQINMMEALHQYYFGTRKTAEENDELIRNICNELVTEDYKKLISGLLSRKNGFGLNRKISELAQKADFSFSDKTMIQEISDIRQQYSHGKKDSNINITKYTEIHSALKEIIQSLVLSEITNQEP